jgi:hypothetical protein
LNQDVQKYQNIIKDKDSEILKLKDDYIKLTKLQGATNTNTPKIAVDTKVETSSSSKPPQPIVKYNQKTNSFEEVNKPLESPTTQTGNPGPNTQAINMYDICLKFEKEKYICTYINNVFINNKLDITKDSEDKITEVIKTNCIGKMKNNDLCAKIIEKINPVSYFIKIVNQKYKRYKYYTTIRLLKG